METNENFTARCSEYDFFEGTLLSIIDSTRDVANIHPVVSSAPLAHEWSSA